MFYIFDPDIAQQVTVDTPLPKFSIMRDFMFHLAGPGDIVSSNGEHWRKWRTIMVTSLRTEGTSRVKNVTLTRVRTPASPPPTS